MKVSFNTGRIRLLSQIETALKRQIHNEKKKICEICMHVYVTYLTECKETVNLWKFIVRQI